jgi:SAM-dependent methyltransferase
VVCGHADADLVADSDEIRAEREMLWEYHGARLRADTPPKRLVDRLAFSEPPPLALVRCRDCGLLYRNPVERAHELTEIYSRETIDAGALAALHDTQRDAMVRQARRLRHTLGRNGTGLEVGSYVGAFLAAARDVGLQMDGVDVNPAVNAFTRSRGFAVHDGDLTIVEGHARFDVVAIWNTFDQLPAPRAALAAAHRLLRPDGVLALRVPNGGFYVRVRRSLGSPMPMLSGPARVLLALNNLLGFPYRFGFTPDSLSRLLGAQGFAVERAIGDVLVPLGDEWTRPWARREESVVKAAIRLVARRAGWAPWFEMYARHRPAPTPGETDEPAGRGLT